MEFLDFGEILCGAELAIIYTVSLVMTHRVLLCVECMN